MKKIITSFLVLFLSLSVFAENITVTEINGDETWTSDNVYTLSGFVFVEDGESLTIEAGTVILAEAGQRENASALIVKRGGKIYANGTKSAPIIMTSVNDADFSAAKEVQGLWGGLIILGKATHNNTGNDNEIEGVPADQEAFYGGDDDSDDSGQLTYVSIRHGGIELAPDEEINGLTLGAVGSSTRISFIEIVGNKDDGVEWFGGAPMCDHILVAYCGDDGFDYDEGFHGYNQFMLAVEPGDNCGEHDGGPSSNRFGTPYAHPYFVNCTYIGKGPAAGERVLTIRDFAGSEYHNSVFVSQEKGIRVEYVADADDSWKQLEDGNINIKNNAFFDVAGNDAAAIFTVYEDADVSTVPAEYETKIDGKFNEWSNEILASDPGVSAASPAPSTEVAGPDYTDLPEWFVQVSYKGAFAKDYNWAAGWTLTYPEAPIANTITVTNSDIQGEVTWTSNNTYILSGFVFVEDGEKLTIEAGTKILAEAGQRENASALIVKRGGQIFANGTSDAPIIMTSVNDADLSAGASVQGLWGGLILLGKATHNNTGNDNEIEGVPADKQAYYGGTDDADNSGVVTFVSIRHGGIELAPDEEINGLTLGAVGNGTKISHIEIVGNKDDGVEWFGGSVNCDHILVSHCGDDGFDYDEGFHGYNQFMAVVEPGDNCGEHDGGPSSNRFGTPYAHPYFVNCTYVGKGTASGERLLTIRDFAGSEYHNSVFVSQEKGLRVEYVADADDSWKQLEDGNVNIKNNAFFDVAGNDAAAIFTVYEDADVSTVPAEYETKIDENFNTWANEVLASDPGVTKEDPTPSAVIAGPVYDGLPDFFEKVAYKGAFPVGKNWAGSWTLTYKDVAYASDADEYVGIEDITSTASSVSVYSAGSELKVIGVQANATLNIYSLTGQLIKTSVISSNNASVVTSKLSAGIYVYTVASQNQVVASGKVMIQ